MKILIAGSLALTVLALALAPMTMFLVSFMELFLPEAIHVLLALGYLVVKAWISSNPDRHRATDYVKTAPLVYLILCAIVFVGISVDIMRTDPEYIAELMQLYGIIIAVVWGGYAMKKKVSGYLNKASIPKGHPSL
ncbi:MAG: hypothetical protein ACE5F3_09255 [Mariprofundaceae bacterium]